MAFSVHRSSAGKELACHSSRSSAVDKYCKQKKRIKLTFKERQLPKISTFPIQDGYNCFWILALYGRAWFLIWCHSSTTRIILIQEKILLDPNWSGGGICSFRFPHLFLPVPAPFLSGSRIFVLFIMQNIAKCCEIFLNFSWWPPPWESRFPSSLLSLPAPYSPGFPPSCPPPLTVSHLYSCNIRPKLNVCLL